MDHDFDLNDRLQAFFTPVPVLTPTTYQDFGTLSRVGSTRPPLVGRRRGDPALGGLACRVSSCVGMACVRCRGCRRGHQFPFVGWQQLWYTWSRLRPKPGLETGARVFARAGLAAHAVDILPGNLHRLILQVADQTGRGEACLHEVAGFGKEVSEGGETLPRRPWPAGVPACKHATSASCAMAHSVRASQDADFAYLFANKEAARMAGEEVAARRILDWYARQFKQAAHEVSHDRSLGKARAEG